MKTKPKLPKHAKPSAHVVEQKKTPPSPVPPSPVKRTKTMDNTHVDVQWIMVEAINQSLNQSIHPSIKLIVWLINQQYDNENRQIIYHDA